MATPLLVCPPSALADADVPTLLSAATSIAVGYSPLISISSNSIALPFDPTIPSRSSTLCHLVKAQRGLYSCEKNLIEQKERLLPYCERDEGTHIPLPSSRVDVGVSAVSRENCMCFEPPPPPLCVMTRGNRLRSVNQRPRVKGLRNSIPVVMRLEVSGRSTGRRAAP